MDDIFDELNKFHDHIVEDIKVLHRSKVIEYVNEHKVEITIEKIKFFTDFDDKYNINLQTRNHKSQNLFLSAYFTLKNILQSATNLNFERFGDKEVLNLICLINRIDLKASSYTDQIHSARTKFKNDPDEMQMRIDMLRNDMLRELGLK